MALTGTRRSASDHTVNAPSPGGGPRRLGIAGVLWWLPVLFGLAYVVSVAVDFHQILTSIYVNSDVSMAPVLGQLLDAAPAGSHVSLGNHAWYEEFLFLRLTRGLEFHIALWRLAPLAWSLGALGTVAWAARRVMGTWAAMLTTVALVSLGTFGRLCFFALDWHSLSVLHTALIVAALIWLAPRAQAASWRGVVAAGTALGVLSIAPTASDQLFPFWALMPMLGTAIAVARTAPRRLRLRVALFCAVVVGVALVGGELLSRYMSGLGVTSRAGSAALVHLDKLLSNVGLLAQGYGYIGGGQFTGLRLSVAGIAALISGVLVLAALMLTGIRLALVVGRTGATKPDSAPGLGNIRLIYVCFWALSLGMTSVVFILSTAPTSALSGRYLLGAYVALGALLPLLTERNRNSRLLATVAVCAFALIATYGVIRQPFQVIGTPFQPSSLPGPATATALARFAQQERVSYGYGSYWDAEDLTWATGFRVGVRPVRACAPRALELCYPQLGMISSWYAPRRGVRSLLVLDLPGTSYNLVTAPDPAFGRPIASRTLGGLRVLAYPYDIAAKIRTPPCQFSWARPC